jgi:hypothetical protein
MASNIKAEYINHQHVSIFKLNLFRITMLKLYGKWRRCIYCEYWS